MVSGSLTQLGSPKKASTPAKSNSSVIFKEPQLPKHRVCNLCKRTLKTQRGFQTHMDTHKWKEAASRKPPLEDIIDHCVAKTRDILEEQLEQCSSQNLKSVITEVLERSDGPEWEEFLKEVVEIISSGLKTLAVAMPSSVRSALQQNVSASLSSESFRSSLHNKFPVSCDISVSSLFVFDVLKSLVDTAVIFLCRCMRRSSAIASLPRSSDDFDHLMTHQVIDYVAGSCLRKQLRDSQRYPHNERLKRSRECILAKFARIGSAPILDQRDKNYWTYLLNRKSLLFVNDVAFPSFVLLGKLFMSCEEKDGIRHERVIEAVVSTDTILNVWDSIVENSLDEGESFSLMVKIIRAATNTYGRGVMLRHMNEQTSTTKTSKASLNITHRAHVT